MTQEGCGVTQVGFHGTMNGDHLEGNLDRGSGSYHFNDGSTAEGLATETTLELTLHNSSTYPYPIPGGTMHLHR
jgi:hypothetical protein